jgi:hypothetical protein
MRGSFLYLVFIFVFAFSTTVNAQQVNPKKSGKAGAKSGATKKTKKAQENPTEPSKSEEIVDDEGGESSTSSTGTNQKSRTNRENKTVYLAPEFGLTMTPAAGLRAGYFVSPNWLIEAGYVTGGFSNGGFSANKSLIEGRAKWIIGNSFYVDAGLGYEMWSASYEVKAADSPGEYVKISGASATNLGAVFHVGNQWQWYGFTLGCDWVGYFLAVSSSFSFKDDAKADKEDKEKEEKDIERMLGGNSLHVGRLYLGWAF